MRLFAWLRDVASSLFERSQVNREMDEELRAHIAHRADDLERTGMSRGEAERRARVEFGGYEKYRQQGHEARGGEFMETLMQDVRFSLRALKKSPGFAVAAVLTLALAIGANAVVFSILDTLVLRPIDVPQGKQLYMLESGKGMIPSQSYLDYTDLRDRNSSFDSMLVYTMAPAGLTTNGGSPSSIWAYMASGNYFDVLGVKPYLGRFFHSSDEHGPNSAPYLVLSYAYWKTHFHGDTNVVGRLVRVNKYPFTVLGVAQPKFRGTLLIFSPDVWVPMMNEQQIEGWNGLNERANRGLFIVGRLKAGVTPALATADLNSVAAYLSKTYPKEDAEMSFSLARPGLMGDLLGGPVRAFVTGLMLLAGLILLAACANLGSLFAARAAERSKEIALRLALGSNRRRILRRLLTEAVLISLAGGVVGLAGAVVLLRWLSAWQPMPNMPISVAVSPDARTYAVALLLAVASGLLFGMVPVRQVLKANPYEVVKAGSSAKVGRRITVRDVLLVVQIAICAVLVTSSLVAVRGLMRSLDSNFGFEPQNATLMNTDLDMAGYSGDRVAEMQRRIMDTVAAIPGVTAAGYADRVPLNVSWSESPVYSDNTTNYIPSTTAADAMDYAVSPGYFRAAATTLLTGRTFTWHDDAKAPRVAVVNDAFAEKIFGSAAKAIGGYFKIDGGTRVQVVGIVEDGKYKTLAEDPQLAMFFPILQRPTSAMWLVVRSSGRGQPEVAAAIDQTLHKLDPALPVAINSWYQELSSALFAPRAATIALGVLGVMGALLSITGLFGMAAFTISRRMRELGIRVALGGQRREVLRAALGRPFKLLAIGSVVGLVLGMAASRVLAFIVDQATPRDPLVLVGVVVAMSLLGLAAMWVPARRALGVDPMILLREE
jgi:predicted permease